jgi:4-hydroxy-4-methyl-2-oxoglutarate aldolase
MDIRRYEVSFDKLSAKKAETLGKLGPALLSDAMKGANTLGGGIRPVATGVKMVGQARTVESYYDNTAACVALPLMKAGEVLVIDANEGSDFAVFGDITALEAVKRNLGGMVTNGVVRDSAAIRAMGLPLFCRGTIPRGPGPFARGVIDSPIRVGGVTIKPGDVIVGDDDGVVAIPLEQVDTVIAAAKDKEKREAGWIAAVNAGKSLAEAHGFPEAKLIKRSA